MRPGLRLQILLLLGVLLLAAFVPLYYAVATVTRYTLQAVADGGMALGADAGTARASRVDALVHLLGLYMGLVALALLVASYFALTRVVVTPLDALSRAAERVAGGARHLEIPKGGPRELVELGDSVKSMTERLLRDEEALRAKIAEVERATRELRDAQDRVVRSERLASVGKLAAGLAHEVGNPISAILGLQDLLLGGELSAAEQRDFLERMRRETERINKILRDLLDFARPSATLAPGGPGNVEAAVSDTVALLAPQRTVRSLHLQADVPGGLPPVTLSREHLVQVLLNLLLNAAEACAEGGHIRVTAARHGGGVQVAVEDDGPGVPPEVQGRLFEPFVTTKEVGKGTGLGLAVCRGIVEAGGGSITLDVEHRPGARFVIEIPEARAPV